MSCYQSSATLQCSRATSMADPYHSRRSSARRFQRQRLARNARGLAACVLLGFFGTAAVFCLPRVPLSLGGHGAESRSERQQRGRVVLNAVTSTGERGSADERTGRDDVDAPTQRRKLEEEAAVAQPGPSQSAEAADIGTGAPELPSKNVVETVLDLYGGPRRFLLVNIPALLIALVADFLGSMQALLSLEPFQKIVRDLRLDGLYPVRGLRRHYIDAPLSCTFSYPGDWVFDKALEFARFRQQEGSGGLYSSKQTPQQPSSGSRLPLVSLVSPAGLDAVSPMSSGSSPGLRVAFYALPAAETATLDDALGSTDAMQALVQKLLAAGVQLKPTMLRCAQPRFEMLSKNKVSRAAALGGDQLRYEMRVVCEDTEGKDMFVTVSAQLSKGEGDLAMATGRLEELGLKTGPRPADAKRSARSYLQVMLGLAPATAPEADRQRVASAVASLEAL